MSITIMNVNCIINKYKNLIRLQILFVFFLVPLADMKEPIQVYNKSLQTTIITTMYKSKKSKNKKKKEKKYSILNLNYNVVY